MRIKKNGKTINLTEADIKKLKNTLLKEQNPDELKKLIDNYALKKNPKELEKLTDVQIKTEIGDQNLTPEQIESIRALIKNAQQGGGSVKPGIIGKIQTPQTSESVIKIKKGGDTFNLTESDIKRLSKAILKEETKRGKGCAESEGGSGCIKKGKYVDKDGTEYPWHILNNKHGGVFKGCTSKKDCESILRVPGVHRG